MTRLRRRPARADSKPGAFATGARSRPTMPRRAGRVKSPRCRVAPGIRITGVRDPVDSGLAETADQGPGGAPVPATTSLSRSTRAPCSARGSLGRPWPPTTGWGGGSSCAASARPASRRGRPDDTWMAAAPPQERVIPSEEGRPRRARPATRAASRRPPGASCRNVRLTRAPGRTAGGGRGVDRIAGHGACRRKKAVPEGTAKFREETSAASGITAVLRCTICPHPRRGARGGTSPHGVGKSRAPVPIRLAPWRRRAHPRPSTISSGPPTPLLRPASASRPAVRCRRSCHPA